MATQRNILLLFMLSICLLGEAQVNYDSTYTSKKSEIRLALRGKAIGFFIFEDWFFATASLGLEARFNEKHSFGIDATWFRHRIEHDEESDSVFYDLLLPRSYMYLDYKYTAFDFGPTELYFNAYCKLGILRTYTKFYKANPGVDLSFLQSRSFGTFIEPGIGFGFKRYFQNQRNGIDINANWAYRFSREDEYRVLSATESYYIADQKTRYPGFYMRLGLFHYFN